MFSALRNVVLCVLTIGLLISTTCSVSYSSTSILLEKDVVIGFPVVSVFDLPNEVTFKIYDSETAAMPIAYQGFYRGEYSAYYNIAMSDGFTQKSVVKFKVEFKNLSQSGIYVDALKGTENFWIEVELDRKHSGAREQLDKETTDQILSVITAQSTGGSDSSNLQSASQKSSSQDAINYQSTSQSQTIVYDIVTPLLAGSDGQIQYNNGGAEGGASQFYYDDNNHRVGIGTANPGSILGVYGNLSVGGGGGGGYAATAAPTDGMIVKGNVGIGTTVPGEKLHVYGDALIGGSGTTAAGSTLGVYGNLSVGGGGGGGYAATAAPTDGMIIKGNVGIGTVVPGATLGVYGNLSVGGGGGGGYAATAAPTDGMIIKGNVGIGTTSPCSDCKLAVNGKVRAKEVVVDSGWSDFVFEDSYRLMTLREVEEFIYKNRHLPGIPTEADVKDNGISVGDISAKLLQKIEELTLYVIELKKENEAVRGELSVLQKQLPYSWSCLGVTCHSMP